MTRRLQICVWPLILLCFQASLAYAEVRVAGVFGNHMVLQRDASVPVWGWAERDEEVVVSIAEQEIRTRADANGKWMVRLSPLDAGGPFQLKVRGVNEVTFEDVLVGEVWLCSGQSNMAMTVSRAQEFETEKSNSAFPQIRHFKTRSNAIPEPQDDCGGEWAVCAPETVGSFTATGYFFARQLHAELNVPIGLINSSWGGTDIAAWTSLDAQQAQPAIVPKLDAFDATIAAYDAEKSKARYEQALQRWEEQRNEAKASGKAAPRRPRAPVDPVRSQNRPANLFNGMIHPLIPYAMRGAIWYQGERNSHSIADGQLYETQLKTLIADWRSRWRQGDFPFGTVQLPNFHAVQEAPIETTGWVAIRESEAKSLELPNTGIAITTDVGDAKDIHPKNKQAVGKRLALWALAEVYEQEVEYSGPVFASHRELKAANGLGRIVINFEFGQDLRSSDGEPLRGFAVAGADQVFHRAIASINDSGKLVVRSKQVPEPVSVRYNWADNPVGNLTNGSGLPAAPFRTDAWQLQQAP